MNYTKEEPVAHLEAVKKEVSTWPDWKVRSFRKQMDMHDEPEVDKTVECPEIVFSNGKNKPDTVEYIRRTKGSTPKTGDILYFVVYAIVVFGAGLFAGVQF